MTVVLKHLHIMPSDGPTCEPVMTGVPRRLEGRERVFARRERISGGKEEAEYSEITRHALLCVCVFF